MNNQLPADIFIKAAADLSGRDPGQLDAREALHILQEYGRQPAGNVYRLDSNEQEPASDLYRQLTDDAANELFSDPQHAAEWADVVKEWDGETPDLLALTLQHDLSPLIREKARKMYDDLPQDDPQRAARVRKHNDNACTFPRNAGDVKQRCRGIEANV